VLDDYYAITNPTLIDIARTVHRLHLAHPYLDANGRNICMIFIDHLLIENSYYAMLPYDTSIFVGLSVDEIANEVFAGSLATKYLNTIADEESQRHFLETYYILMAHSIPGYPLCAEKIFQALAENPKKMKSTNIDFIKENKGLFSLLADFHQLEKEIFYAALENKQSIADMLKTRKFDAFEYKLIELEKKLVHCMNTMDNVSNQQMLFKPYQHPENTTATMRALEELIQNKKSKSILQNNALDVLIKLICKIKMPIDVASNTFIVGPVDNNFAKRSEHFIFQLAIKDTISSSNFSLEEDLTEKEVKAINQAIREINH